MGRGTLSERASDHWRKWDASPSPLLRCPCLCLRSKSSISWRSHGAPVLSLHGDPPMDITQHAQTWSLLPCTLTLFPASYPGPDMRREGLPRFQFSILELRYSKIRNTSGLKKTRQGSVCTARCCQRKSPVQTHLGWSGHRASLW